MEEIIQQVDLEQRKASLLSVRKFSRIEVNRDSNGKIVKPPEDKYHLLSLAFLILGVGGTVPISFFLSANDYWMYKFRDLDSTTYDATIKNTLQKNFISTSTVISSISSIVTNVFSSLFAHKLTLRTRFVGTISITVTFFIMYTGLVLVDTDSWQLAFFFLTMFIYFLNNIAGSVFNISNMAMISKFPPFYIKFHIYGSSVGILMGSVVQIVCLWIAGSTTQVALIYFSIGTIICVFTLITAFCIQFIPRFNFYQGDVEADTSKPLPSWNDLKEVSKNVWQLILGGFFISLSMTMGGSAITSQVTSDHYKIGDPWTDKYFVPALVFFLPGVTGLIARFVSTPILNKSNVHWWLAVSFIHAFGVMPLLLFCNSPKEHLPVLFPYDWEFITLQTINSFMYSYLGVVSLLSTPAFGRENLELTFMVMATYMGFFMHGLSPLTSVWVNIQ